MLSESNIDIILTCFKNVSANTVSDVWYARMNILLFARLPLMPVTHGFSILFSFTFRNCILTWFPSTQKLFL